jgi:exodeoxyribonuclease V gamma subunit
MSFVGRHIRDDSVMPPSVLVSELVDYVERAYRTEEGGKVRETIVTLHPLQAFSRRYFEGGTRLFSHSKTLARAASVAGRGERTPRPFITGTLGVPDEESRSVDVEMLVRFFRNPARQLFERRLKVRLESADDELEAREPFAFDGLALYDLKERLLDLELRGAAPDGLELARAGGVLPYGRVGEVLFAEQSEVVAKLAQTVAPLLPAKLLEPVAFEMKAGPLTFRGALTRVSSQGLLDYRPVKCSANVRVRTWIRHLVLSAFAPKDVERVTRCVAQDCTLVFGPVDDARKRLRELLDLYWQGMQRPLHFFPRTACAYVEHGEIDKAVLTVWRGGYDGRPPGERDDPYYALAFRDSDPLDEAFEAAARTVFAPLTASVNEEERI